MIKKEGQTDLEGNIFRLESIANIARGRIIDNSYKTNTPHLGSCLSCVDILVAIYFDILKINPDKPKDHCRDRFILSKGHAAPAVFQILAMRGFYPDSLLETYGQDGSVFAEHPPTPDKLPGIEAATGSLGHGLPIGLGMAMSSCINHNKYKVYVLLGDGESNEGSIWEAAMMASAQNIDNLVVIVDFNKWQATDQSAKLLGSTPFLEKWRAFGWDSVEIDGNNMLHLVEELSKENNSGKPKAIIANTIKGKGVSFMEDDNNWHYRTPTEVEVKMAFIELGIST